MLRTTREDEDDAFVEKVNTTLLLLLGLLAAVASVVLFGYSAIAVVCNQQFSTSLLTMPVFAALLLVTGIGSVHLFRKRRQSRKEKADQFF